MSTPFPPFFEPASIPAARSPTGETADAGVQKSGSFLKKLAKRAFSSNPHPPSLMSMPSSFFDFDDVNPRPRRGMIRSKSDLTSPSNNTASVGTQADGPNFEIEFLQSKAKREQDMIAATEKLTEGELKHQEYRVVMEQQQAESEDYFEECKALAEEEFEKNLERYKSASENKLTAAQIKREQERVAAEKKFEQYRIASESKFETYKMTTEEIIVQLRIRVGVLENDLKREEAKAEQGRKSLVFVVQALTGSGLPTAVATPDPIRAEYAIHQEDLIKDLQEEIESLRKEDRTLRAKLRRREWDDPLSTGRVQPDAEGLFSDMKSVEARRVNVEDWQATNADIKGNGKAEVINETPKRFATSFGSEPPRYQSSMEILPNGELSSPNQSFGSGSATIANTPMLARDHSAGIANIGMVLDLEDVLGGEFPEATSPPKRPTSGSQLLLNGAAIEEEEKTIEEQMLEHERAMQKFQNVPKPGVLKTGTDIKGGARGEAYVAKEGVGYNPNENDYGVPRNYPQYPRRNQHYNRFECMPNGDGGDFKGFMDNRTPLNLSAEHEELLQRGFDPNIWKSDEERNSAVDSWRLSADRKEQHFPEFFKHSVVYVPAETDNNVLRTVHIGNLPADIELREVLAKVRGGQVIHAILLNTFKQTGGMSALITFVREGAADDFVMYTGIHPLTFGDDDEKATAEVTLISTPTYPMSAALINKLNNHCSTRCLRLPNFPTDFSLNRLERNIACGNKYRAESLVEMYFTPHKTLHLEFSSIAAAGSAFAILTRWQTYQGLEVHYAPDPCAGPVEELQLETEPRKPLFPKGGFTDGSPATAQAYSDRVGGDDIQEVEGMQRKRLAALDHQKVEIPDCSGKNLMSSPWADDTDDEDEPLAVKPAPSDGRVGQVDGFVGVTRVEHLYRHNPLVGLAGSMFATPGDKLKLTVPAIKVSAPQCSTDSTLEPPASNHSVPSLTRSEHSFLGHITEEQEPLVLEAIKRGRAVQRCSKSYSKDGMGGEKVPTREMVKTLVLGEVSEDIGSGQEDGGEEKLNPDEIDLDVDEALSAVIASEVGA
jgi:hypothetical protein